jgi:hypothetical protein
VVRFVSNKFCGLIKERISGPTRSIAGCELIEAMSSDRVKVYVKQRPLIKGVERKGPTKHYSQDEDDGAHPEERATRPNFRK